ncbi:mannose-1-phosphate guanylyltransferase/mannose-6-phosphate isomerase [Gammaproteobacteria bacterium]|nr:mannose-1-phosphate guanylyltransferase/mannose-6-phosphate isomerase [Gammaproteobacteria bacterium]MDC3279685.1 mannose-1-phosphate guanylyltransferase/mannose-6-phosphate isomerase [Gammaproteobacteria bacterium]
MIPVILSGGAGTRLWPLSRQLFPKQFHALMGKKTLIQDTVLRVQSLAGAEKPVLLCNEDHRFMAAGQLDEVGISASQIILEPVARGTAPAIAVAAELIKDHYGNEAIIGIFPADHMIRDQAVFLTAVDQAISLAEAGHLVTFGVSPNRAYTGYGYLKVDLPLGKQGAPVQQFVEKPDAQTAESYLSTGGYFWNSGMFVFKVKSLLKAFDQYAPQTRRICTRAVSEAQVDDVFVRLPRSIFEQAPNDSIDYAVMEKAQETMMVPLDAGWSDIGSWDSIYELLEKDNAENVTAGNSINQDTSNSLIFSHHGLVVTKGLDNIVIVNTSDAVLVANRSHADNLKSLVEAVRLEDKDKAESHQRVYRPWGSFDSIDSGDGFQVKRIIVDPGKKLSLQRHQHRAEHWVVVSGTAQVTLADRVFNLDANQSTYIARGVTHRLANLQSDPLEIIEVQTGDYLGEDDIERLDDDFNRGRFD